MIREVIEIEESKCDGCGNCVPGCPEGALQIIDGKARLVADYLCDGLGACVGECPTGALKVIKKETGEYNERLVMENISKQGINTIKAHIKHLKDHGQTEFLKTAYEVLKEKGIDLPQDSATPPREQTHGSPSLKKEGGSTQGHHHGGGGCPGSRTMDFSNKSAAEVSTGAQPSELRQWPVQLHLVSPAAPYFNKADLLLAADCVAFSMGNFHRDYLKGKALAIACPKLDEGMEVYEEKLTAMVDESNLNTITVMRMQVPCCGGLVALAKQAVAKAKRKIPIKAITIGLQGEVIDEQWV